ncbi:MAG: 50S ribosomal protein L6 [Candidatus Caldarchaeum sp.]
MSTKYFERTVALPENATVKYENGLLTVEGSKGRVVKDLSHIPAEIKIQPGSVLVRMPGRSKKAKAMLGTVVSVIENAVEGVTKGFTYKMKVVSSHFPITVKVVGSEVVISNFLGERYDRKAKIVGGVKVFVKGEDLVITGVDKEAVGQTAANIENATRIGRKDPRKFLDGVYLAERVAGA